MFASILIANRGEIARRVMRTAKRMGMRTIAVYSDADAGAAFVREADEAVRIGLAPAAESYLRGDLILEVAKQTGAEAIHPGYGFLSENAEFAEAVTKAGRIWIGPPPDAIRAMGLKHAAKALMAESGVPLAPGYHGDDQTTKALKAAASEIGYPVLIKAVAGGGGRGMRRVDGARDFETMLTAARREAKSAFGDDRVLVERFIQSPRHIEVQVFGDAHGNVIHLFERDCSLQRRRQKVIEEAPAPGMTDDVRAAITSAAVKAATAVGYQNAGTVEFIVDGSGPLRPDGFWFMEMNTRLQVEHPVTEMITGLDLMELQFRVAAGEALPAQETIRINGHAVEARLCAEDPARGFMPSSGRLDVFSIGGDVRIDSAVEEGDTVPPDYDSLIAKIIAHGPTRDDALDKLDDALSMAEIWPLATNAALLVSLTRDDEVRDGVATTALVEAELETLTQLPEEALVLGAVGLRALGGVSGDPWAAPDGFRVNAAARATFAMTAGGSHIVSLGADSASIDGEAHTLVADVLPGEHGAIVSVEVSGLLLAGLVRRMRDGAVLFTDGHAVSLSEPDYGAGLDSAAAGDDITAPMPGKIIEVRAKAGDAVKKGDALVVMEAMKMEHQLTAPRDGIIAAVETTAGSQTVEGAILVRLQPLIL